MQGTNGERWKELCARAAVEQDPEVLMGLVREINSLLEAKQRRLEHKPAASSCATPGAQK